MVPSGMLLLLGVGCFITVLVNGQVPGFGKCPAVDVVADLDVNKYLGEWYEIEKFFFLTELGEDCIVANYSLKSDGHIKVFNTGYASGQKKTAEGDGVAEDPNVKAKLSIEFNGSPRAPYWIVDTDYENYSLIWSCVDFFGAVQTDFAWILARQRTLDATVITKLKNKLSSFNVNVSNFRPTNQKNCPE